MTLKDLLAITQPDHTLEIYYLDEETGSLNGVYAAVPETLEAAETDEDFPGGLLPRTVTAISLSLYDITTSHTLHLTPHLLVYLEGAEKGDDR